MSDYLYGDIREMYINAYSDYPRRSSALTTAASRNMAVRTDRPMKARRQEGKRYTRHYDKSGRLRKEEWFDGVDESWETF